MPSEYTTRAPKYVMMTTSRYGKPNARKTSKLLGGGTIGGNVANDNSTIAGTAVTEARAATTAYRGGVGTTTLNIDVQTATQDNPIHESGLAANGCRNSAAAMP